MTDNKIVVLVYYREKYAHFFVQSVFLLYFCEKYDDFMHQPLDRTSKQVKVILTPI